MNGTSLTKSGAAFIKNFSQAAKKPFEYWLRKNHYYHGLVTRFYQSLIPRGSRVLQLQCKNGYLLASLGASFGVGIDDDEGTLADARNTHPQHEFHSSLESVPSTTFDYIIVSFAIMETGDINTLLNSIGRFCNPRTRIIIETYTILWAPILWITQKIGLRRPSQLKNWVAKSDLDNFTDLAGYDTVTRGGHTLCPLYIPLISPFLNTVIAHVPFINRLCLHQWTLLRPVTHQIQTASVSVIVPCRNEKGNIKAAVERCPSMGKYTELIFVEGHSHDGTLEEITKIIPLYPEKNVTCYVQKGKGKSDAVRMGFEHATGDVVMILDADLTTPPEELPQFLNALLSGKGECINGSRLVYGMESQAMDFLSLVANKFFGSLISWITGQTVTDSLCGTKVLWRNDYHNILAQRTRLGSFDPFGDFDLLFGASLLNLKIINVPIHYKRRTYGKTNICRFKDVWFLLLSCGKAFLTIKSKN